jgi:4-amino-4-deoxy-L-arabinose transferase-like glycosyltransferase
VHGDEAEVGLDALRLLESTPFNLFRTGWYRLPIFHAVPTAIGLELFGRDLVGLRATSAVIGTVTVVLTFALARRLWNLEIALLSALVLATGRYFIHLSRAGYHYIDTPCISVAVLLLFLAAWRERRLGPAVWCGIVLGLGMQTYYASRLIAPLLLVTWLVWLWRSDLPRRRERLAALFVAGIAAAATAAPMIGYFSEHWIDLWRRSIDTSVFSRGAAEHLAEGYPGMSFTHIVLSQLRNAVLLFNLTPDTSLQYGLRRALLDPASAVFFVLGLAGVCTAIGTRRAQLLLLWIVVPVIVGGALTIDAPFYPRISGALPFVAITIALGIAQVLNGLRAVVLRLPDRTGVTLARDATHVRSHRMVAAGCTAVITGLVLATVVTTNLHSYFADYAPSIATGRRSTSRTGFSRAVPTEPPM